MKVIVLTPNYPRRGAMMNGFFIHQQVKALMALGVDCHVILTHNWFPPWGLHRLHVYWQTGYTQKKSYLDEHEGVPIHHVPVFVKMPSRFFSDNAYQREADAIVSYIKRTDSLRNADWIYANFLTDCGYVGTLIKEKLKVKLAAIARGDDVHAWPTQDPALVFNLHEVFRKADLLLANSMGLAEDVEEWFTPEDNAVVKVIYNGIDAAKFLVVKTGETKVYLRRKHSLPHLFKLLLCVATPVASKGWLDLFEAIKKLEGKLEGWKLVAVFPRYLSPDALNLSNLAASFGIVNDIILHGPVEPEEMPEIYQAVDAFILPSHNEGMANCLLEALACGLPVIATDVGGHREVLQGETKSVLVKPCSSDALARAIVKLLISDEVIDGGINRDVVIRTVGSYTDGARRLVEFMQTAESNDQ